MRVGQLQGAEGGEGARSALITDYKHRWLAALLTDCGTHELWAMI